MTLGGRYFQLTGKGLVWVVYFDDSTILRNVSGVSDDVFVPLVCTSDSE